MAVNVGIPNVSDIDGNGDFIFSDWPTNGGWGNWDKYFEFSITAKAPLELTQLKYTFFSGMWSSMTGPAWMRVYYYTDNGGGFVSQHVAQETSPLTYNCPNNFIDTLSIGELSIGEQITFRFFIGGNGYWFIPAGFWNKGPSNYNVTLEATSPVPIPGAVWLFGSGLVGLIGLKRKRLG